MLANHFYEVSAKVKAPKEETALRRWYRFVPDVFFCIVLGMHFMGTWPKMKKNYAYDSLIFRKLKVDSG